MRQTDSAAPLARPLLTIGSRVCLAVALAGAACGVYRFAFGLQASTNLSQQFPWGLWIVADVSLIALAASGFVTGALAHILHRDQYHTLVRPALVFAVLGYTFACILLAADLGRYYNIWHPLLPNMWQGNSALFEVGMCVMAYLTVLYLEVVPMVARRIQDVHRPGLLRSVSALIDRTSGKAMYVLVVLGVTISCLHQSSLGHVMVLAGSKLHPLWWTPILALLFVISAIVAALPTAFVVSIGGAYSLNLRPPMRVLGPAAKFVPLMLFVYLAIKLGDMLIRRSFVHLTDLSLQSLSFGVEITIGIVIPMVALMFRRIRFSAIGLFVACGMVMFGVVLNRANVYWIGYRPASATTFYVPSLIEVVFTVGAVAAVVFLWRLIAILFPVISESWQGSVPRMMSNPGAGFVPDVQDVGWEKPDVPQHPEADSDHGHVAEPVLVGD